MSCLQKSLVRAKYSVRLAAALITIIFLVILFYAFFFVTFRAQKYFPTPQGYSPFKLNENLNEKVILPFYVKKI
jgi:hypothetical protein